MTKNLRSNIVATVDVSTPQKRVLANQREEVRGLELDERKEKILKAIMQTYLETGEPLGSEAQLRYDPK